jgi:Ala-tRNA(Pro) deacylase
MIASRLKSYLEHEGVEYRTITHSRAYAARATADAADVSPQDFAKAVIVNVDGRLAMAVLAASEKLDLARLKALTGAKHVRLAQEPEFARHFPGCEPGAMPPFGNLYGMAVYVSRALAADERIAFNAGSHDELISMRYRDFDRLAQPVVAALSEAAGRGPKAA